MSLVFSFLLCAALSGVYEVSAGKKDLQKGIELAEKIYSEYPSENVYSFQSAMETHKVGSDINKIWEFYYQETNCTKTKFTTQEDRNTKCKPKTNGSILICETDVSSCKSTGAKYRIELTDPRNKLNAMAAADDYNWNYSQDMRNKLHLAVYVWGPMERKILHGGFEDFLRFSTREHHYEKSADDKEKVTHVTKPMVDCSTSAVVRFTKEGSVLFRKFITDCEENKHLDAIKFLPSLTEKEEFCTSERAVTNGTESFMYSQRCYTPSDIENSSTDKESTKNEQSKA